jgi:hypothetical protein
VRWRSAVANPAMVANFRGDRALFVWFSYNRRVEVLVLLVVLFI